VAPNGFLDALPVVVEIGDLILPLLDANSIRHLCTCLDNSDDLMKDRQINARHVSPSLKDQRPPLTLAVQVCSTNFTHRQG